MFMQVHTSYASSKEQWFMSYEKIWFDFSYQDNRHQTYNAYNYTCKKTHTTYISPYQDKCRQTYIVHLYTC